MTLVLSSTVNYSLLNNSFCIVQNSTDITITSSLSNRPAHIVCNHGDNSGFGFFNVSNLRLLGLTLIHCGGEIKIPANVKNFTNISDLYIEPHQRAVILISHCRTVMVQKVSVYGLYFGFAVLMVNALGTYNMTNIAVSNTEKINECRNVNTSVDFSCSGSGIVFVYMPNNFSVGTEHVMLFLSSVRLYNNSNFYSFKESIADKYTSLVFKAPIVSGAGLTFIFFSNVHLVQVWVTELNASNNTASHAGAVLMIYIYARAIQRVYMALVHIQNNSVAPTSISHSPGLTFITLQTFEMAGQNHSHIVITSSYFVSNHGYKGGAILFLSVPQTKVNMQFELNDCVFINNVALLSGSAVHIEPLKLAKLGGFFHIRFTSVEAIGNGHTNKRNNRDVSVFSFILAGSFFVVESSRLIGNIGSAIEVYGSVIQISGFFVCTNNTSTMGSCILLKGISLLMFHKTLHATVSGNNALLSGGAIFAEGLEVPSDTCTIALDSADRTLMTFSSNTALLDGHDVKISNLYGCTTVGFKNSNLSKLYSKIFQFTPKTPISMSSRVEKLVICSDVTDHAYYYTSIIHSGQTIFVPLRAVDAVGNPVYTTVVGYVFAYSRHKWQIIGENYHNVYADTCNVLNFTIVSQTEESGFGELMIQTNSHSSVSLTHKLRLLHCPLGFSISSVNNHKCDCSSFLASIHGDINCDVQHTSIKIPMFSWFGELSDSPPIECQIEEGCHKANNTTEVSVGFSFNCPPEYCHATSYNSSLPDPLCKYKRKGVMCGQCADGFSTVFGSDECQQCSDLWMLSLIVYAILGLALVLSLFAIKLTITSGVLGGPIFFANISAISLHTSFLSNEVFTCPYRVLMAVINLNLGFPVCFYNGMSNISKAGLQFLLPLYLCCLVLALVVISRYSVNLANLIVGSSVQVLVTLIHLSFAKLLLALSEMLTSSTVISSNNYTSYYVWYFDGNIKYMTGIHLWLFVLSLTVIVLFVLPYLVFITVGSHIRHFRFINLYSQPIVDAYSSPYKERYGFWFGVRQWLLVSLYITYSALRGTKPLEMLMVNIIALVFFTFAQVCIQPFKSKLINLLDTWFLFLLFSTNITTFFFLSTSKSSNHASSVCITLLMTFYILSLFFVILFHCILAVRCSRKSLHQCLHYWTLYNKKLCYHKQTSDTETREPLLIN